MGQSNINQLQLVQQNLQNILIQKQQLQDQITEIDSALDGLKDSDRSYRIVGHIMISQPRQQLQQELEEKKEMLDLRLKKFITQEEKLKKSMEDLQKEVVKEMGASKNE
ncbi:MAG: prefoldin subunit beta [Nanoarchaeota archaeon]